jgi:tetratricopeptide (TPR) repeat protein
MSTLTRSIAALAAVAPVLACAAASRGEPARVSTPDAPATAAPESDAPATAPYSPPPASDRAPSAVAEPAATRTSGSSVSIWMDAEFQRRFADSYLAETEVEPRVTADEREALQEALELISADRLDEAVSALRERRGPGASAALDFTLANVHFQRDELDSAAAAYRAAVDKYPKFRRAWKNLGVVLFRKSDFEGARRAFARVVELGGGDAVTYGLLGFSHASAGDHQAAESAYRCAILLDPRTIDWQMGLTRSFFEQRRYADAVAACGQLIAGDPGRADLWLLQARAQLGAGDPLAAAQGYEIADRLGGSTSESLTTLGDIYVNAELFDLAVGAYERALELEPPCDARRVVRAARVLAARGALESARRLADRLEAARGDALEPDERKDLLRLRARVALAEGAGDEEARVLQEIVELDPLDGDALILLGQHFARTGDLERAAFYYERAAGIEAFEPDAKVRHAQLLVGAGRYTEALPLLRRAQTLKPRENVQEYLEQVERVASAR